MNLIYLAMCIVVALLTGCAITTPINKLGLPPVSIIQGEVKQLDATGFVLKDKSDTIFVRAKLAEHKKLDLRMDEDVKVYGNLLGGQERIFDGYVIEKSTGEQIIITSPTPHFGLIIQSSFN